MAQARPGASRGSRRGGGRRGRRRPRGARFLFGLDRSGPDPRQTRAGQPLRPWTLPNLVGYLRLAAIPLFLYLALSSPDGRDPWAAAVYFMIVTGDYVDGFVARATGQYSRLGALLDPAVDRAAVLAGAFVCWHFALLPRWALAALAAREVVIIALAQVALRRNRELEINWLGRVAVWPVMAAIFLTMVVASPVWSVLLVAGLALALAASVLYVRTGWRELRGA